MHDPLPPHLSVWRTPLIAREAEAEGLLRLVNDPDARLITVTGMPGIGKTRLAMEVARQCVRERRVVAAELTSIHTVELVMAAFAAAVRVGRVRAQLTAEDLAGALAETRTLLVADGVEHLAGLGPVLVELLASCPELTVMVTSRVPLQERGERLWRLHPLVPTADGHDPAVELFAAVAASVDAKFELGPHRSDVTAICRHLDGHPLAIELAAARSVALGPTTMRRTLGERSILDVLGPSRSPGGAAGGLRATLGWAVQQLPPAAAALLRRVAVFRSWFSIDDAEAVAVDDEITDSDVLLLVVTLVDHHLLEVDHRSESRYRLCAPVRDMAMEQLRADCHDAARTLTAHRQHLCRVADERRSGLWTGRRSATGLDDLYATLTDALRDSDHAVATILLVECLRTWIEQGAFPEQWSLARTAIDACIMAPASPTGAATVLGWAVQLAVQLAVADDEVRHLLDGLGRVTSELDPGIDRNTLLDARFAHIRVELMRGRIETATALSHEALSWCGDDEHAAARFHSLAGLAADQRGDVTAARRHGMAARTWSRAAGDTKTAVRAGLLLLSLGPDPDEPEPDGRDPRPTIDDLVAEAERSNDPEVLDWVMPASAAAALLAGDRRFAAKRCSRLLFDSADSGWMPGSARIGMLLVVMTSTTEPKAAARITGMLDRRLDVARFRVDVSSRAMFDHAVAAAARVLGRETFDTEMRSGRALSWPHAHQEMLELAERAAAQPTPCTSLVVTSTRPLTRRETDVLRQLADGGSNKEIGLALHMTSKTVMHHASSIYRKLGVRSRTEAVAVAHRLGLLTIDRITE